MKAVWNGQVLAESQNTLQIGGDYYFPEESINKQYFIPSDRRDTCFWRGEAFHYSLMVDGKENKDAAWYFPEPKDADFLKGYIAFWRGVQIEP